MRNSWLEKREGILPVAILSCRLEQMSAASSGKPMASHDAETARQIAASKKWRKDVQCLLIFSGTHSVARHFIGVSEPRSAPGIGLHCQHEEKQWMAPFFLFFFICSWI